MPPLLDGEPDAPMIEFDGRVYSRGQLRACAGEILRLLDEAGVPGDAAIGIVGRNRPMHAAAILGLVGAGRTATMIHAFQSPAALANDLAATRFAAVVADPQDWTDAVVEAARATGTAGIVIDMKQMRSAFVAGLERCQVEDYRRHPGNIAVEILSSGTTGTPKRIPVTRQIVFCALDMVKASGTVTPGEFDISPWPISSIGGVGRLVANAALGRPIVYFDKFAVDKWVDAVRRHRPRVVTGMPAMAQMVMDANVPADDLASVEVFYGGSAPFDPDLKTRFEGAYGLTVLWAYGATEFYGTVISWSEDMYREWGDRKVGSSGRALPGVALRVVDPESGAEVPPGTPGLLHARVDNLGPEWIATNDMVVVDADGFMFHKGRNDGAIVRGGFKVLPETIRTALREHPAVLDAVAVGRKDPRLGEVPIAAVELASGVTAPSATELLDFLQERLNKQAIPVELRILDELPRTPTLKVELATVRAMFDDVPLVSDQ